tara:strand:+ start:116 stop:439 length:324 start_codon:yes stop_codon:yes gene_type:complete
LGAEGLAREREGIAFEERDLLDPEIMEEAKARTGVRVAPITLVAEKVFYGTFPSQKPGLDVAGPPPMGEAAMLISRARGLQSEDLHADVFFTPAEASARRLDPRFFG